METHKVKTPPFAAPPVPGNAYSSNPSSKYLPPPYPPAPPPPVRSAPGSYAGREMPPRQADSAASSPQSPQDSWGGHGSGDATAGHDSPNVMRVASRDEQAGKQTLPDLPKTASAEERGPPWPVQPSRGADRGGPTPPPPPSPPPGSPT